MQHYQILEKLGEGGMGAVYRARDTRLNRDVALKILPPHGDRVRFQSEARALAALNHPNIVAIYDVGENYIASELVDGTPLKSTGIRHAIDLAAQVADGLAAAHSVGIAHRDLKPANILVTREGRVKIIDFGLVKHTGPGSEDETRTVAGTVLGTAAYMSPEQVRAQDVDERSDLFSLGVILYEMAAGKRPFGGETVAQLMTAIMEREPDELPETVPSGLRQIIYRCLQKERAARFQGAADLAFALRSLAGASASHHSSAMAALPAARISRTKRWLWPVVGAVSTVAALGLGWMHLREQPAPIQPVRFQIAPPEEVTFADLTNHGPALISPDGTTLLFPGADKDGKIDLYLRPMDSIAAHKLEGTHHSSYPFWSPDSKQIAFFQGGKLMKLAVSGGIPLPVCDAPVGRGGDWAAEGGEQGMILFAPNVYAPIMVVPAAGGIPKPVTNLDTTGKGRSHRQPTFLPGGRRFLYLVLTTQGDIPVMSASLDGGAPVELFTSSSRVTYAPPAKAGEPARLLLVRDGNLMYQRIDPDTLQLKGDPIVIAPKVNVSTNRQVGDFSVSRNGILAYRGGRTEDSALVLLDRQGKQLKMLGERQASQADLRMSNSGKRAAYIRNDGGNQDIWTIDLEREVSSRLTFEPRMNRSPVWSPDDKQIAYVGGDLLRSIFLRATDGSGARNLVATVTDMSLLRTTDWSRDGRFLLLTTIQRSGNDLQVLPVGLGGGDRKLIPLLQTQFNEIDGRFSPDGRWIAYNSDESGSLEVYVGRLMGKAIRPSWGMANGRYRTAVGLSPFGAPAARSFSTSGAMER